MLKSLKNFQIKKHCFFQKAICWDKTSAIISSQAANGKVLILISKKIFEYVIDIFHIKKIFCISKKIYIKCMNYIKCFKL